MPAPAAPSSQQRQQLKIPLPAAGQPRAREAVGSGGEACGAILRGLRDYSWPVNIDSASSGATAQPGSTVFRARWEARRVAESGALSEGGRGQGEDVSSVIFSERLPAAARERGTPRACRRLRGGQPEPLGCTERLPWGWRNGARTRAAAPGTSGGVCVCVGHRGAAAGPGSCSL